MKIRCEEFAYVWVPNGQGGYYEIETHRHLSLNQTVFPDRSIRKQRQDADGAKYTLQAGKHQFDFKFKVPHADVYPQTLKIPGTDSGIKWYIKCNVHRGNLVGTTKRQIKEFVMIPNSGTRYAMQELVNVNTEHVINCYKTGYAEQNKTASGKIKNFLPGSQSLRAKTTVNMCLSVPDCGLLQSPDKLNINLDLSCADEQLLFVKRVDLLLKQKIIVSVNNGWNTSLHRDTVPIISIDLPNLALKPALAEIQKQFNTAIIRGPLPRTFQNLNFDLTYKLVAEVTLGSNEKPTNLEKIRASVPIELHNYKVAASPPQDEDMSLPFYSAQPQEGEAIVNL